jgi:hypothetical protein
MLWSLRYCHALSRRMLLQLTDSTAQIRSYVFDVVRATVPNINLDDVFEVRRCPRCTLRNRLTRFFPTCPDSFLTLSYLAHGQQGAPCCCRLG